RTLPLGQVESMAYYSTGTLHTKTDFNGKTTTYDCDTMNRLRHKIPDASFAAPTIAFTYKPDGMRETMTDATGTTTYDYDLRHRLTSKATPEGTLTYTYDDAGNFATLRTNHAGGASVDYVF